MSATFRNSANLLRLTVRSGSLKSAKPSVLPIVPIKAASTSTAVSGAANANGHGKGSGPGSLHGPNHQNCLICAQRRFSTQAASSSSSSPLEPAPVEELEALNISSTSAASSSSSVTASADASAIMDAFAALKKERNPNLKDFTECLERLAEVRDFPRCAQLLTEMKAASVAPDCQVYSLVLSSVRRTLRPSEIRQLFGEPFPQRFVAEDAGAGKDESSPAASESFVSPYFAQARDIVNEMRSAGIKPAMWFYEDFANQFAVTNQGGLLINLATAMEKRGEEPSTKFYNRMLHCLPRCGLFDRATMLFNRMVLRGTADYYTFLVRASSLIYTNQPEAARAIISDARARFPLDTVAYNILIKSYLSQRDSEQAIKVFQDMIKDSAIAPTRVTCRTFLSYFYESGDLFAAEPVVSYFSKAGFPETSEDYANLIKFFARYDPPRVLEVVKDLRSKTPEALTGNYILHSFLRVLNDRRVVPDWKRSLAEFILEATVPEAKAEAAAADAGTGFFAHVCPELPFHYRAILQRISQPDATTLEIVMKKLLQLKRFDSVIGMYDSIFAANNSVPSSISVGPVHRNLYLTALISAGQLETARAFVSDMQQRRIPISGKNTSLLSAANISVPAGAMTVKKGQGITVTPRSSKLNLL